MPRVRMGREHAWDLTINAKGYMVLRDERGAPAWNVQPSPEVVGQTPSLEDVERPYRSWHAGYGWSDALAADVYHYCDGLDARWPRQLILGPLVTSVTQATQDGNVTGFFELGSYLFTISGRYVNQIDPSNDTVSSTAPFPYDLGASHDGTVGIPFDGKVYIATSTSRELVRYDAVNGFVPDDDSKQGNYLAKFFTESDDGAATWVIAQAHLSGGTPSVAWCAQGAEPYTAANWSAAYEVGDKDSVITGLAGLERTCYVAKTDGLYFVRVGGIAPKLFDAQPKDATNGVGLRTDRIGTLWYPSVGGLIRYDPAGDVSEVTPGRGLSIRAGVSGVPGMVAQYGSWYYTTLYDGTNSYLMAGREREEGEAGGGTITWHGAIAKVSTAKVTSLWVSSLVTPPRLWMGLSTGSVAYVKLPSKGDNPLLDSNCFVEETSVWSPSHIRGASRRWYEGTIVELTTASGHKLAGTPNHAILTRSGWKALGLLAEGDDVVCYGRGEEGCLASDDPDDVPTTIGQVYRFLDILGTRTNQPGVKKQFHGDGQESDVDIVLADGLLQDGLQTALAEPVCQESLAPTDLNERPLPHKSALMQFLGGALAPSGGGVTLLSPDPSLFRSCLGEAKQAGFTVTPDGDAFSEQNVSKGSRRDADGLGDSLARLSVLNVPADQLLDVVRQWLSPQGTGLTSVTERNASFHKPCLQEVGVSTDRPSNRDKGLSPINVAVDKITKASGERFASQFTGLPAPTNGDACLHELATQDEMPDTDGCRDNGQRLSTFQVTADRIVKVNRRCFTGHVYNLQTGNEWYTANGIIAHNCRFAATGSIYLPADDFGIGGMRWNLMSVVLEAEGLSASTYVDVYERRDLGTWTLLQKVTTSGRTVITTSGEKRFNRCEMRLDVTNASSSSTPIVRVLVPRAARRPTIQDVISTRLLCSDHALARYLTETRRSGADMMAELKGLDEYYPVTLKDWWSGKVRSRTVIVMPVGEAIVTHEEKGEQAADLVADVVMRVVG